MRNSALAIAVVVLGFTAACQKQQGTSREYAEVWKLDAVEARITALEQRIGRLEPSAEYPYKLSDSGFGFIETDTGGGTLQWTGARDNGNGVRLSLKFGNPSSASWNRYSIIGSFGKLQENGEPDESSSKPFSIESDQQIPAGAWKTVSVQLDGPKAENVGFLRVRSIIVSSVGLIPE
jgi:hypothetical protein